MVGPVRAGLAPDFSVFRDLPNETGFIELARRIDPRLVVILVRAPLMLAPMAFAWFEVRFTPDGPMIDAGQAEQSRNRLVDFIHQLPAACGVDPARIWIAGFSQGGIMSASVALTAPETVSGFGLLGGRILPELLPSIRRRAELTRLQAFVGHGEADQTLGVHFARSAKKLLLGLELPIDYHEYPAGHVLNNAMADDFDRWIVRQVEISE